VTYFTGSGTTITDGIVATAPLLHLLTLCLMLRVTRRRSKLQRFNMAHCQTGTTVWCLTVTAYAWPKWCLRHITCKTSSSICWHS